VDSAVKFPVRAGLEDLPERIEIAHISEVATGTCAPPPNVLRDQNDLPTSQLDPSPLSFSLISAHEGSLADQIAPDQSRWADWTDGLNMLRRDGGHVASQETAEFVRALTEIGLKIKLLGGLDHLNWEGSEHIFHRFIGRNGRNSKWPRSWTPSYQHRFLLLGLDVAATYCLSHLSRIIFLVAATIILEMRIFCVST
jgi:hypothetical protein